MKKNKLFSSKYLPLLKNKYLLTSVGFIIWLSFFDRNDFITTWTYHKKLKALQKEEAFYDEEIKKNTDDLNNLLTNRQTLEKYAREHYLMKKDNEDIFVTVTEHKENKD